MSAHSNTPEKKANRKGQGLLTGISSSIGIVVINEIPKYADPELATAVDPITTAGTAMLLPPALLGALVYVTGGSRIAWRLLKLYYCLIGAVVFIGIFAIPILLWEGVL